MRTEVPIPILLRIAEERKRLPWWRRPFAYHPLGWAAGWWSRFFSRPDGADYFDPQLAPRAWPHKFDPFDPLVTGWKKRNP